MPTPPDPDAEPEEVRSSHHPEKFRLLPQSPDAEKGVLSSFLLAPRDVGGMCAEKQIKKEHFFIPSHGEIFEVLFEMWTANRPIDFIVLTTTLGNRNMLERCGGSAGITELFTSLPTAANCAHYLEIVVEKFTLREMIKVCTEFASRGYDEQHDAPALLNEAEAAVLSINRQVESKVNDQRPVQLVVMAALEQIDRLSNSDGKPIGIPSGLTEIDDITGGYMDGEVSVIAGRPGSGKSALAMGIADHVAVELGMAVGICSLEMTADQLIQRAILRRARVSTKRIKDKTADATEWRRVQEAGNAIHDSPIYILEKRGITNSYLSAVFRRWKRDRDIKLGIIDYIQLLRGTKKYKGDNRQMEVSEISESIKTLAGELGIHIIVLAQLNRNPEARTGSSKGVPKLSDLRESGSIEQDADLVGLLHRPEMSEDNEDRKRELRGKADLNFAKNRNGPNEVARLTFMHEWVRFTDRAYGDEPN